MRKSSRTVRFALLLPVALCLSVTGGRAADEPPQQDVFRDNTEQVLQGAAALAGAGGQGGPGSTLVLGLLIRGDQLRLWKLQQSDQAPPLRPALLKHVKDETEVRIDDSALETEAYCEAVLKASFTSPGAFANSAHDDVTFRQLHSDPWKYRGEVIHYEGKLRRVDRLDAPAMLNGKGIQDLYECWIFGASDGANPVCLICTELPEGVRPGDKLSIPVKFDAYFFKKYRYRSVDSEPGKARVAPLFIGRTFVAPERKPGPTPEEYTAGSKTLLMVFLGFVFATFVLAFALHFWYRRNDRRVQAKLRELRSRGHAGPDAPGIPDSAPWAN